MHKVNITPVRSIERAIDILQTFASEFELTLDEITGKTNLPRSTVYRILCTLEGKQIVQFDMKKQVYKPGLKMIELGLLLSSSLDVYQEAEDVLVDLHNRTRQTVLMAVKDGDEILYVFKKETRQGLKVSSVLGQRRPYIYGVLGPVLLAFEDDEKIERILQQPIPKRTPYTVTDINVIRERLRQIRSDYLFVEANETTKGVIGIGAPVFNAQNEAIAAIGVVGPTVQITDDRLQQIMLLLFQSAKAISKKMGYSGAWPMPSNLSYSIET
jgi:DNA-binding IclR family transcriptional regulator